jgi:hypothetical protein
MVRHARKALRLDEWLKMDVTPESPSDGEDLGISEGAVAPGRPSMCQMRVCAIGCTLHRQSAPIWLRLVIDVTIESPLHRPIPDVEPIL